MNKAGSFSVNLSVTYDFVDDVLSITFYADICINTLNVHYDSYYGSGSLAEYDIHLGQQGGLFSQSLVYEAIEAHERGHALEFFLGERPDMLYLLYVINQSSPFNAMTANEIEQRVKSTWTSVSNIHSNQSGTRANQATLKWFDDSSYWREVFSSGGVHRWIKE